MSVMHQASPDHVAFYCPACEEAHMIRVPLWQLDGNMDRPTISPSIAVRGGAVRGGAGLCHSFVRDGRIEYLLDSTHAFAGHTIDLPEWPL